MSFTPEIKVIGDESYTTKGLKEADNTIHDYKDFPLNTPVENISIFWEETGYTIVLDYPVDHSDEDMSGRLILKRTSDWVGDSFQFVAEENDEKVTEGNLEYLGDRRFDELDIHHSRALALLEAVSLLVHSDIGKGSKVPDQNLMWEFEQLLQYTDYERAGGFVTITTDHESITINAPLLNLMYTISREDLIQAGGSAKRLIADRLYQKLLQDN